MPAKEGIRKLFDSIAPDYDRLNHLLSLDIDKSWRRKAIQETLGQDRQLDILDVACGTGDFAIGLAKASHGKSHITGIDISENMLSIGREKVRNAGLDGQVELVRPGAPGPHRYRPHPGGVQPVLRRFRPHLHRHLHVLLRVLHHHRLVHT